MANNRLWAVCKDDGKCIVLLKNYADWYHVGNEKDHDEFFQKHINCKSNKGCGENIEFVTEVGDDKVLLFDFSNINQGSDKETKIYLKSAYPNDTTESIRKKLSTVKIDQP